MSFIPVGKTQDEDTDARSRQIDDGKSIMNSVSLLKTLKDVKVQNVCGSTAGAGSGTFHKYRQCKRREQFRIDRLKKEEKIKKINERIKKRKRENDEILEAKRSKKRRLRQKKKERRMRAMLQEKGGNANDGDHQRDANIESEDDGVGDANAVGDDEEEQLKELLNIDKALSNDHGEEQGAEIDGDGGKEQESEVGKPHSIKETSVHDAHNKQSKNAKLGQDVSHTPSKRDAILAALDAEFADIDNLNDT